MTNTTTIDLPADPSTKVATVETKPIQRTDAPDAVGLIVLIERLVRDEKVSVDKMERMIQLHRQLVDDQARVAYATAMVEAQSKMPKVQRRGMIVIRDKNNKEVIIQSTPFALWEDINEVIKPILYNHGFSLSFRIASTEAQIEITAILTHNLGHSERTSFPLPFDTTGSKNNVQARGSSISYGKRYAACAMLNITTYAEDDDGRKGGGTKDNPDDDTGEVLSKEQVKHIKTLIAETNSSEERFLEFMKEKTLEDIPASRYGAAVNLFAQKKRKAAEPKKGSK